MYLVGHADSAAIRDTDESIARSNYQLSLSRANRVAEELNAKFGITNAKIIGVSNNYSAPDFVNSLDRRVDIYISTTGELIDVLTMKNHDKLINNVPMAPDVAKRAGE